ncbi:MAG: phospholipid scramblase 1 [Chaenotheca gracillima]|nr:MAG: phospholipid scramblase 1 [Chaenotheca gracillima]
MPRINPPRQTKTQGQAKVASPPPQPPNGKTPKVIRKRKPVKRNLKKEIAAFEKAFLTAQQIRLATKSEGPDPIARFDIKRVPHYVQMFKDSSKTRFMISESYPFIEHDTQALQSRMERIYSDLHEISASGFVANNLDLSPIDHVQGKDEAPIRSSIKTLCCRNSQDMRMSMEYAQIYMKLYERATQQHSSVSDIREILSKAMTIEMETMLDEPDTLGRVANLADRKARQCVRVGRFAVKKQWTLFCILLHSAEFRRATECLSDRTWTQLEATIQKEARSIEMFAKTRKLDWSAVLRWPHGDGHDAFLNELENEQGLDLADAAHPHQWFLPIVGSPQRTMYQNKLQVVIDQSHWCRQKFRRKPRHWPEDAPWPSDPTIATSTSAPCYICKEENCSSCELSNVRVPLIELVEYPGRGRGVRSLQYIPADEIIAEYVGEIIPFDAKRDPVYPLLLMNDDRQAMALINPACRGNWTRYMNHSCEPKAKFQDVILGNRRKTLVITKEPIYFGEEITVDYGCDYWGGDAVCQCGEDTCKYSNPAVNAEIAVNAVSAADEVEPVTKPAKSADQAKPFEQVVNAVKNATVKRARKHKVSGTCKQQVDALAGAVAIVNGITDTLHGVKAAKVTKRAARTKVSLAPKKQMEEKE